MLTWLCSAQALTDNFLGDLGMTTNGTHENCLTFSSTDISKRLQSRELCVLYLFPSRRTPFSQLVSKWVGPDRWIPTQMVLWLAVASGQFGLRGWASFLATRALLGILQGGFIPDVWDLHEFWCLYDHLLARSQMICTCLTSIKLTNFLSGCRFGSIHLWDRHHSQSSGVCPLASKGTWRESRLEMVVFHWGMHR
jgi:hypothetical protein